MTSGDRIAARGAIHKVDGSQRASLGRILGKHSRRLKTEIMKFITAINRTLNLTTEID